MSKQKRPDGARQSDHGGSEQQRKEGAQESAGGPAGSMQSGAGGARQQDPTARPASAIAGRPRSKDGGAG